ncbi:MAG: alpha/beta hydrolase [Paracoccaceae bacterium]|nr:alpha/beta hydrolase [Paracoccaceae bacterium]
MSADPHSTANPWRALVAMIVVLASVWILEAARSDVEITQFDVAQTPVTQYAHEDGHGSVVVIAHGFAGSQQMMQGYALPLARAGYRVFAFEFLGHGRHPNPMTGDVSTIDGTTRLLVDQTAEVIDAVAPDTGLVALLGHSMATDILVRTSSERKDIGPIVLISAFSKEITATQPGNLLLITGAWEAGLRAFAQQAVQMVNADASEGETVTAEDVTRRAIAAPFSEHVSVLQSRTGRGEALAWIDLANARTSNVAILPTGWAILGLLGGLVMIFHAMARLLPLRERTALELNRKQLVITISAPLFIAPLIAVPLKPSFLPVLVADYLMLHLLVFGTLQLVLLRIWGLRVGPVFPSAFFALLACCAFFGFALDRYAANFWPTLERFWIIAVITLGAVPYMVADAILSTDASWLRRLMIRGSFLASLGIAVALDFNALFFLIMIAPVLVLFYVVFGTMARATALRSGPLTSGVALGIVLAWALGVSFPLFQP